MSIADWIVLGVIVITLSLAGLYVYRAKKKGRKCIGCSDAGNCSGDCANCKKQ